MLTWAQLGHHQKPCGLLNVNSYYDELFAFLEKAIEQQFVKEAYRPMMMMGILSSTFRSFRMKS